MISQNLKELFKGKSQNRTELFKFQFLLTESN